jgi:hypothetical protein
MTSYWRRVGFAFRTFFSILDHSRIPPDVATELGAPAPSAPSAPVPDMAHEPARAIQFLAVLQRDGRLVDFLVEDLSGYQDAQVGAAVRDVHTACRQAVEKYLTVQPVMVEEEGARVTVQADADLSRIKVVGNLKGQPPYRGILRHRGWEAVRIDLPPLPAAGRTVLAQAEVEVE